MASIAKDLGGQRRLLFVGPDKKRRTIRLGKVSQRMAEAVKFRVEQLLAAKLTGHAIDADTARWVADLPDALADKLARVGLIPKRETEVTTTLGPFLADYVERRIDVKPATKVVWSQVIRNLNKHFGEDRDIAGITEGEGDDFKMFLIGEKLAPTTVHKRLRFAKMFFLAAKRQKLIIENPFEGVSAPAAGIQDRQRFVTRDEIARVLAACPDHHWRTIVTLSRYGGLRCPSEVLSLRWQDVDWESGRIVVTSPKTAHHPGKGSRTIPFFAELRQALSEAFELAPEGSVFVVDEKYRKSAMGPTGWQNVNLRTTFQKIVSRASLQPWPRLFHNLRASRETELVESYPVQAVTSWLGNTPGVALRHYLMTTDEHFAAAIKGDGLTGTTGSPKAAQNVAQSVHVSGRNGSQADSTAQEKTPVLQGHSSPCDLVHKCSMELDGLEPTTPALQTRCSPN